MIQDLLDNDDEGRLLLRVHVSPGAGRSSIVGRHGDALKVRVAAPPVGGRANAACVTLLARVLGLKEDAVELISGDTSRTKRLRVTGIERDDAARLLEGAISAGIPGAQ
jgi:uncharacterized protein